MECSREVSQQQLEGNHGSLPSQLKGTGLFKYSCQIGEDYEYYRKEKLGDTSPVFKRFVQNVANKKNVGI